MYKRFMFSLLASILTILLATVAIAADAPALLVGASSASVNPPVGSFLGGYDLNRTSTGVHDDLCAKAVVVSDGVTSVALVVVDSFSIPYDVTQAIRSAAAGLIKNSTLPPRQVIVQSTHSHAAPDTIGIYGPNETTCGRSPEYMKQLVETAAQQVAKAAENMKPAGAAFSQTQCAGWAVNDSEPDKLDNSVTVLQFLDKEGKSIATLTNFACHPTVLDGDNTLTSADWVASFYKSMSAKLPGEHLFLQGAIGCWMQPNTPERTFELAQKYGEDLASKTLAALQHETSLSDTRVRFASRVFNMPIANDNFKAMSLAGLVPRNFAESVETEAAWFAIGPAQFATHLGETAPVFAAQTRELMDTEPKFILGLGLDHLGYICPPDYFVNTDKYPFAKYLVSMSPSPQAGPVMMEALKSIVP
ncbi:MAG: neutral/alkaline non-lysosomal ceramidase N-terminal domain-containing protein [Candidatus Hydrogenedentes bacterium]|nr:neutral/alkaline non-lysosomal ceramidase N-terminal domain-containing protein [Candidatus Hydrogenedentota bacterium]